MHQSSTYERILREGRQEGQIIEARRILLLQGTHKFGEPDQATVDKLESIQEIDSLEALGKRMLTPDVARWDELLQGV
jgi:hypothetical protein